MSDLTITRDALRSGVLLDYVRRNMPPGTFVRSDAEIEADLDRTLADHDGGDLWLFGYGSLMWNPALEFVERRTATALGWHRRFCLWMHAGRGSPEQPGLMLALDQGGRCQGLAMRMPPERARDELLLAWRREMFGDSYLGRWVNLMTDQGPVRAVTFVANRDGPRYTGPLPDYRIIEHIASAQGRLGTNAAYLRETHDALKAFGLRDRNLERLADIILPFAAPAGV